MGGYNMRSILKNFPTEEIILHKPNEQTYVVTALVSSSSIQSEDISIPIEPNDYFERKLPSGVTEYYQVIDAGFYKGMHGIPDHYQTKVKPIKEPVQYETDVEERHKMIFISHSSLDKDITKAFVDLLFGIGLNEDDIVCSSYPGLGVPLRESIYEWLIQKFQEYDLHVLYFLSHNYYKSAASLNEMGAAWAMKQKWDSILLPGFSFSDISGCIDPTRIGIKLDGDPTELKHRLGELKDDMVSEFGLRTISDTRWERIRDSFISKIGVFTHNEKISEVNGNNELRTENQANELSRMTSMVEQVGKQIDEIKDRQLAWEKEPKVSKEDIGNLFIVKGETLCINSNNKEDCVN